MTQERYAAIRDGGVEAAYSLEAAALELLGLKDEQRQLDTEIAAQQAQAMAEVVEEFEGKRTNETARITRRDQLLASNQTYQDMLRDIVEKRNEIAVNEIAVERIKRIERWARLDAAFLIAHGTAQPDWLTPATSR